MQILICNGWAPSGWQEEVGGVQFLFGVAEKHADLVVDLHTNQPDRVSSAYPIEKRIYATCESPVHLASWMLRFDHPPRPEDYALCLTNYPLMLKEPNVFFATLAEVWMHARDERGKRFGAGAMFSGKRGLQCYELRFQISQRAHLITIPNQILHSFNTGNGSPWQKQHDHPTKDILSDWMFQFAIENVCSPGYFTEKVIDCFATHTVPLYLGDPQIGSEFDLGGIIVLQPDTWLEQVNNLTPDDYYSRLPAIKRNFWLSRRYWSHARSIYLALTRAGYIGENKEAYRWGCTPDRRLRIEWRNRTTPVIAARPPRWPDDPLENILEEPPKELLAPPPPVPESQVVSIQSLAPEIPVVPADWRVLLPEGVKPAPHQRIFTFMHYYFESSLAQELALLEQWYYSWKARGWEPVVLDAWSLKFSPENAKLLEELKKLPTRNAPHYTLSTFARWLAVADAGGGWMSDHDVINYSFPPHTPTEYIQLWNIPPGGQCPCLVSGLEGAYRQMIQRWVQVGRGLPGANLHYSDQQFLGLLSRPPLHPLVARVGEGDWFRAPVVHFGNDACQPLLLPGENRSRLVLRLRSPAGEAGGGGA